MSFFSPQRSSRRTAERYDAQDAPPAGAGASTLFKRYRPLETRASGGFGSVEICLDARLQRRVAIKRMPLASGPDGAPHETTATALSEARTASMLQHPNIVQVIDFTYDSAYAYLVMEYVDGVTLEEFLAGVPGHSLTFDEAACIADALVQALSYAHENGVLHLDIKPANVLIDRSGHVKLTDFGMAALASSAGFGGARGGTIGYMPPEQLRGEEVDERSDIFALACVLYESLCAEAPFRAATPQDSLRSIERGATPPRELLPDLPENTEQALLQALSPDPRDRMRSVNALGERFLAHLGNAREGRRSLERIIARLTSDDPDEVGTRTSENHEHAHERAKRETDPAKGFLGSRLPRARQGATGVVCGLSTAWSLWHVLLTLGLNSATVRGIASLAIGIAATVAPPLGSALVLAGTMALVADAATSLSALPISIVIFAVAAAWWYVWGRAEPAASAAFAAVVTLVCSTGGTASWATLAAALAGCLVSPSAAAAATGLGVLIAHLTLSIEAAGAFTWEIAASTLADPSLWLCLLWGIATAALESLLLARAWTRYLDGHGTGTAAAACLVPALMGTIQAFLAAILGAETTSLMEIAGAAGVGALSSIMVFVCVYMLGLEKEPEGDDRA